MTDPFPAPGPIRPEPRVAVAEAIQKLMVARLGRGFLPLALLFAVGMGRAVVTGTGGWWTAVGAVATSAAMLAYGLRIVQGAVGREPRAWMTVAMIGSVVPPVYATYLVGWLGLRELGLGVGLSGGLAAILHFALGVWVLRCWMKVVELERLARVMFLNLHQDGGPV